MTSPNGGHGVPILNGLLPVLTEWKLQVGSEGRVIHPMRCDGEKIDIRHTPGKHLRRTLKRRGLARPALQPPSGARRCPLQSLLTARRDTR